MIDLTRLTDLTNLIKETILYVVGTLLHNAPVLVLGIVIAAAITVYVDPDKMRGLLMKKSNASVGASVLFGAFTPFCACGTMAVIVAMMTTSLPWAPVMAFLTSSPLMSPDEFILISGIVSVKFAVSLTVASVIVGLGSGYLTHWIEKRTDFFKGQGRFNELEKSCSCGEGSLSLCEIEGAVDSAVDCTCNSHFVEKYKIKKLLSVFYQVGIKQVLMYFSVFAAIGFLINKFVPANLIMNYMGAGNSMAVPLMALIGLPLYVSGSSAIPIINALIAGGASQGALLAFMITGPGTSAGVIAGLLTIMRKKAIGLYLVYLVAFAIVLGYIYDYILFLRW